MIAIFDEDGGGDVDFQEFVSGLSAFSSKGNKEEKLRFAFKVYDIDRDGYISNGELFIVLKMMVGSNLKDQQLQQVCSSPEIIAPACFPRPKISNPKHTRARAQKPPPKYRMLMYVSQPTFRLWTKQLWRPMRTWTGKSVSMSSAKWWRIQMYP